MQTNSNISDELLTRYLCGDVSDIERLQIEDYLAESDKHIDELLTIAAAVEQYGSEHQKRRIRPLWPAISAAASVALIIGIGVTFWHHSQSGTAMGIDQSPAYAAQDSIDAENNETAIVWEDSL